MAEASNTKNDFVNAIAEAAFRNNELSSAFPSPEELLDPTRPMEDAELKLPKKKYSCHYGLFDLSNAGDRVECELINDKCMNSGWILAGEERTATKEGNMFIMLKWLVPADEPKKANNGLDEHSVEQPAKEDATPSGG